MRSYPQTIGWGHAALTNMKTYLDEIWDNIPGFGVGRVWYVAAAGNSGDNNNSGKSPLKPFATMAKAFSVLRTYDRIVLLGDIREQVAAPANIFDVSIVGIAPRTRNGTSGANLVGASSWRAPAAPTAATPLLELIAQGWVLTNILMNAPADAAAIKLTRTADAYPDEKDASHFVAHDMQFVGGLIGIQDAGGIHNYLIQRSRFRDFTGAGAAAIKCTSTGVAVPLAGTIRRNEFVNNKNHILSSMESFVVEENLLQKTGRSVTVDVALDTIYNAGQGGHSLVHKNKMAGFDAAEIANTEFVGHATDSWSENYADDAVGYGVPA